MNRRRLALALFAVAALIVVVVGLARGTNSKSAEDAGTTTTVVGVTGDLSATGALMRDANDVITTPADGDCRALVKDPTPSCNGFEALGTEYAWTVDQTGKAKPVASFIRRDSPTSWSRVLQADGGRAGFDTVNVRTDDITGDGGVETIYGFHSGKDLSVDVVSSIGKVILHLDLGQGQVLVGGGQLITFQRKGSGFVRAEIKAVSGKLTVIDKKTVKGPASGNL